MRASISVLPITAGLLCCLAAQALSSDSASRDTETGSIYIAHVTVIDTETGKEESDRTVVISGDRISEVRDSKGGEAPAGREGSGWHGQVFDSGAVGHACA